MRIYNRKDVSRHVLSATTAGHCGALHLPSLTDHAATFSSISYNSDAYVLAGSGIHAPCVHQIHRWPEGR